MDQIAFISEEEKQVYQELERIGQIHLVKDLAKFSNEERTEFVKQYNHLNKSYPGGLGAYTERAKKLLQDAKDNVNPYEKYFPEVPKGETVDFSNKEQIDRLEGLGLQQIDSVCFVLVAGGLGERLGYKGIKVEIPIELLTQKCFLQYYIEYILALQKRGSAGLKIPFAIMTSDDTYALTVKLLQENNYFGMEESQITIMKQEKVPSMINNDAHFAQVPEKLTIETKPHGHGDVHCLLYQHKLHDQWLSEGKKWIYFFQDTNPLAFRSLLTVLGVSVDRNLEVNSITVPRKPGEAIGSICRLQHKEDSTKSLTINVEYNQLDSLLKSTVGSEKTDENGNSIYPGNINSLVFKLEEYTKILNSSGGVIAEFINPKYADSTKTVFKSATRLECMMQDYPKLLPNADNVGFTQIERGFSFAAVKNDIVSAATKAKSGLSPECSGSCEEAFYRLNAEILRLAGAEVEEAGSETQEFANIPYRFGPKIVLNPDFGVSIKEIREKLQGKKVVVSKDSSLVINGNYTLSNVSLDGHLVVDQNQENDIVVDDKKYQQFVPLEADEQTQFLQIRGFKLA